MKKSIVIIISLLALSIPNLQAANRYWVAAAPSNFNNTANWSTSSGGASGASVPTIGDFVYFDGSGIGNCNFDTNVAFDGIRTTGYTGQINLAGYTFNPTVSNSASLRFENGTIIDSTGTSEVNFNTTGVALFNGTTFNTPITCVAGRIQFNGGIFNNPVVAEDNGGSSTNGEGGCTFNSTLKVTNSGTSYFLMGYTNPDIFNGDVTFLNTSTSRIRIGYNAAGNQFNGNILVGSTNGSGVWFGENGGTATLVDTKIISIDGIGFSSGDLRFKGFTQTGSTAQSFTLTGTAITYFQNGTTFNGNVSVISPRILLNGSAFAGTTNFTKTGASDDNSNGGNTFTGNCVVTNNGTGSLRLGYSTSDTYTGNLTLNNTSTSSLYLAYGSAGNTIGGNLIINNSGTGTNSSLIVANNSTASLTITGTTVVTNNSTATNRNRIYLGNQGDITFNNDLTIINNAATQDADIYCNDNVNSNNIYNGNIIISATHASSDGIRFGQNNGSSTLAAGKTVTIGAGGFVAGTLQFRNFTQVGSTAQNITLTGTGYLYNYDASWGGNATFTAPRFNTRGTTYSGTSVIEKNGATNDASSGGNTFVGNSTLKNSGSGYLLMGNAFPDAFNANVILNNTGTYNLYLAHNSIGNTIAGTLTINNTATGTNAYVYVASNTASSLNVVGNTIVSNTAAASNGRIYLGDHGDITLGSDLTLTNAPSGTSGYIYLANNSNSSMSVAGNTSVTNSSGGTTKRVYVGNEGDIGFTGTVNIANNATATNSEVYLNNGSNSLNQYHDNIVISSTTASTDGIRFGEGSGSATLASGKTITIGAGGFVAGTLQFRNFTQIGNTAHNFTLTGTATFYNYDASWGGNITITAPRFNTRGTTYSGTSIIEKTGANDDASNGGNTFVGNSKITNSGSRYLLMGNSLPDVFNGDLILNNIGTHNLYLAHNSTGNSIAGTLTINNNSAGTNAYVYVATNTISSLSVGGNTTVTNTGAGTSKRIYLGNSGDIVFNGTLNIANNATAANSEIYLNNNSNSLNEYKENIVISSTNALTDGIRFGESSGSATLASGKTITIGGGGFVAGSLRFKNFTQLGTTIQNITLTGTGYLINQDSDWGGNVYFSAPRNYTSGTTFNGTVALEKTGATSDASPGGNTFTGNTLLRNSGSGYFMMGNGSGDSFGGNLDLSNTGTSHIYVGYNGAGNTIGGNLSIFNASSGTTSNIYLSSNTNSTLTVSGVTSVNNMSTATNSTIYLGENGDINFNGILSINNAPAGTNGHVLLANNTNSAVTVSGNTLVTNAGAGTTKRVYLGNSGDVTFNGTLDIINSASATNSEVFCNYGSSSVNVYNQNITLASTHASNDGIRFGQNTGASTLANGKTVTLSAGGFIAGQLQFRNFDQIGSTPQSITLTGTATMYQYDSEWGGNTIFKAPRFNTRGTTYSGTCALEKTGGIGDDACTGGNTFVGNTTLTNSGSKYLMFGNGTTDLFQADVDLVNSGSSNFYFARSGAGHSVAGNLNVTNTPSGTSTYYMIISDQTSSTLNVTGNVTINTNGTGNSLYTYLGDYGDVTVGGDLSITNAGTGYRTHTVVANHSSSTVPVTGATTILNSNTASTYNQVFLGNSGDMTFNSTLDITNNSGATNSGVYLNYNSNSTNSYLDDITVTSNHTNCDGIRFGQNGGNGTLANGKSLTIPGVDPLNFIGGELRFRNFTQIGTTPHSFELASTATYIYNWNSTWGGNVSFTSPRIYTRESTFLGSFYNEKIGTTTDYSYGGNTFAGNTVIVNNNTVSSGTYVVSNDSLSNYAGDLTLKNTGTYGDLVFGSEPGVYTIAGNLIIENSPKGTGSQYLYFSNDNSATVNIAGTATFINNPTSTANTQNMVIANRGTVNIAGNTVVENTGTGGSSKNVYLGNAGDVNFGGDLSLLNSSTATSAQLILASNSASTVVISGNTSLINAGAGTYKRTYFSDYGDITFNGNLDMVNNATATYSDILLNYRSGSVNTYNGNITLTSNSTSCDGYLFGSEGGAGTLAATKTISIPGVDATNFIGGQLYFRNFTQTGATAQGFELASTATYIYNYNSNWGGNVTFSAPRMYTRGTTYNGTAALTKSGGIGDDYCVGGNTFVGNTTLTNSGSRYFLMGSSTADVFQANLDLVMSGSHNLYLAYNSSGNSIAGNLTTTNSATGTGDYRMYIATGTPSSLTIGGNTTITNNGTGKTLRTYFGSNGDITMSGNLTAINSGSGTTSHISLANDGNSTLSIGGTSTITNNNTASTSNRVYLGYYGDMTFNGDLAIVNNAGSNESEVYLNDRSGSVGTFNGNITVATYSITCDGIIFGSGGGAATLASGKSISIPGVDATNFTGGQLFFRNFTQTGSTAQSLELGSNATYIYNYNSTWGGNVDFKSPRTYTRSSVFSADASFTKTGGVTDYSYGGNTIAGNASYSHQGTGTWTIAHNSGNDYNGDATFTKSATGPLHPVYNTTNTLAGDITINSNTTVTVGSGGSGRLVFDGTTAQSINKGATTPTPRYRDIETSNASNDITLNTPLYITKELDLNQGNLITTSTNVIYMNDNSIVSSVSNNAFVDGPLVKVGNDAFTFPVGDNGIYAPITMTNPSSGSAQFEGQYFNASPEAAGFDTTSTSAGLDKISDNEYWVLNRIATTNTVKATIGWNSARSGDMGSGTLCDLRVARWDGTKWVNEGNGGTSGDSSAGTVITGTSEDCSTSTKITSWVNDYPITLATDSNFITWDGLVYDGGSGTGGAPSTADAGRILKVFAPGAVANIDASLDKIIVTPTGKLTIASGIAVTVSGIVDNNGEITIENNGSLVQTSVGTDENIGSGTYFVERTGNTSSSTYNIWSSPIKNADLMTVFSGGNPCDMWVFDGLNQAWSHDFTAGYSTSCYGNAVTFTAADVITGGDGIMDAAKGYFLPGAAISTKQFSGDVNNGDITVAINQTTLGNQPFWNDDDWNLLGNPYPSALDAAAFWTENAVNNTRITDALYFWDDNGTGTGYNQNADYASWNALGGVNSGNSAVLPSGSIASGQGFWVVANENTNVVINNSMRSGNNDQFFKKDPDADKHLSWISATTPSGYNNNILVGYTSTTTDTVDALYDAHKLTGNAHVRFASMIDSNEFSIQGFEALRLGENKVIPLVLFTDETGVHSFEEYKRENIPANVKIYIRDLQKNTTHDLALGVYAVRLIGNQTYSDRFELVFEKHIEIAGGGSSTKGSPVDTTTISTDVNSIELENSYSLVMTDQVYTLANDNGINGDVHLIDINGRLIWSNQNTTATSLNIDVNGLSAGIYFVQVTNGNERVYHHELIKR